LKKSGTGFDLSSKRNQLKQLEKKMARPDFWDNQETAQSVVSQLSALKAIVEPAEEAFKEVSDLNELFNLAAEESDGETLAQIEKELGELLKKCDQIELEGLLSGPNDMRNCFFSIHAGAGERKAVTGLRCCFGCIRDISKAKDTGFRSLILFRVKRRGYGRSRC